MKRDFLKWQLLKETDYFEVRYELNFGSVIY